MFLKIKNFIKKIICKDCEKIFELKDCITEKDRYKHAFEEVTKQYKDLINKEKDLTELEKQANYWNNRHTKKEVFYLGRWLKTKTSDNLLDCDVKNFIQPMDALLQKQIKDNNLKIKNSLKCNDNILKIYKYCRKDAKYAHDSYIFGKDEVWLFPFEFLYLNKSTDCDDNSHYIASMLIGAGVPSFRVRVVCGMCNFGGHSTVYCLLDDMKTWAHLNSTGGYEHETDINKFPTSKDAGVSDGLGIHDVWFSFNNEFSFSDFEKRTTASQFKKELGDKIKII